METRTRGRTDGRRGFTLVELIAVIGIIALMSTLVLGGFSGILGAISSDSCENTFRRAVSRARQEACVTGKETFVWVTGVRSFVVVRAASTITDSKDGGSVSFAPSWYRKKGEESSVSVKDKDVIWIVDEDADLADAQEQHRFDSNASDADLQRYVDSYEGVYVFDMDGAAWARVKYPPWYEFSIDAWVFGIRKDFPNGKFKARSAYGWSVMPEQHLPAGFVFDVFGGIVLERNTDFRLCIINNNIHISIDSITFIPEIAGYKVSIFIMRSNTVTGTVICPHLNFSLISNRDFEFTCNEIIRIDNTSGVCKFFNSSYYSITAIVLDPVKS